MKNSIQGYRGYVGSRPYPSGDFPQFVQNLIIRNYCQKNQLTYLLSATEYIMPGCYMMLEQVLSAIESVEGIVLFSIFMLPESACMRQSVYEKVLKSGRSLHGALEDLSIKTEADIPRVEAILSLNQIALTEQSLTDLQDFCVA